MASIAASDRASQNAVSCSRSISSTGLVRRSTIFLKAMAAPRTPRTRRPRRRAPDPAVRSRNLSRRMDDALLPRGSPRAVANRSGPALAIGAGVVVVIARRGRGRGARRRSAATTRVGANAVRRTRSPNTNVVLQLGEVTADSAGPPVAVSPRAVAAVIDTIGAYVEDATVKPLRSGAARRRPRGGVRPRHAGPGYRRPTAPSWSTKASPRSPATSTSCRHRWRSLGLGDQDGNLVLVTAAHRARRHGQDRRPGRSAPHRPARPTSCSQPDPAGGVEGHVVQHGGHPRRRRPVARPPRPRRPRPEPRSERRACVTRLLLVAPVVCGLLLAGARQRRVAGAREPDARGGARCGSR